MAGGYFDILLAENTETGTGIPVYLPQVDCESAKNAARDACEVSERR